MPLILIPEIGEKTVSENRYRFLTCNSALFSCRFMVPVSGTGFRRRFLVHVSWA